MLAGGWWIDRPASTPPAPPAGAAGADPAPGTALADPAGDAVLHLQFNQAVLLLHAGRHAEAVPVLQQVLALAPRLPEAHVNLGFALLGLQRPRAAREHFDRATVLAPGQANAYYGLAMAWEAIGDLPMATGAMRSYLHLARAERPEHLARARAALWTWEQARRPGAPASGAAREGAGRELASPSAMPRTAPPHGPGNLPDSRNRFPMPANPGSRP